MVDILAIKILPEVIYNAIASREIMREFASVIIIDATVELS